MSKVKEKAPVFFKRKRRILRILKRNIIDAMSATPDIFSERQRNRKNSLGLASIAYQINPETGRKLKVFIKKTYYTLTKEQSKVGTNE